MSQRQRDDMVILAHIRDQHRLSLQSYGRPRMTEELQELGLRVKSQEGIVRLNSSVRVWGGISAAFALRCLMIIKQTRNYVRA